MALGRGGVNATGSVNPARLLVFRSIYSRGRAGLIRPVITSQLSRLERPK
jgi:hypothetical protein